MSNPSTCLFAHPNYADPSVLYTPTFSGGSWVPSLPLANLADRRLARFARSASASVNDTIIAADLKVDRPVRIVALPKHSMSPAGQWRVVGYPSSVLFDYEVGDNVAAKGGTFSRAGTATYVDATGVVRTAASGVVRDAYYIGGVRHLVLEGARTNLSFYSEDFTQAFWTRTNVSVSGSTTSPSNVANGAQRIIESTATAAHAVLGTPVATSGASTHSAYVRPNGRTKVALREFNATGAWASFSLSGAGSVLQQNGGTASVSALSGLMAGWYRLTLTVTGASQGFGCYLLPNSYTSGDPSGAAGSYTGDGASGVYLWGAQSEIGACASSYIPTTSASATRNADTLYFPYTPVPQAMTVYTTHTELGTIATSGAGLWELSSTAPYLAQFANAGVYRAQHHNGTSAVVSDIAAAPAIGATVELRVTLSASGIQNNQSVNRAAETSGAASGALALAGAWGAARFYPNAGNITASGFAAFRSIRIAAGSSNTLATMQGLVYDSGWLTPWPGSLTAEDLAKPDGTSLNIVAFTQVPATFNNARYWTIQLNDPTNNAGYLDVARLWISGALTPSVNMSDGAKAGYESDSVRSVSPGGAALYDVRASRRTDQFSIENLTGAESLANVRQLQRQLGLSGQFLWIPDPSDTTYGYERNFLAVLRELGALEARALRYNTTFGVVEEL